MSHTIYQIIATCSQRCFLSSLDFMIWPNVVGHVGIECIDLINCCIQDTLVFNENVMFKQILC